MSNIIKNPAQDMAIDLYASQPNIQAQQVADKCNVPIETIYKWRKNVNFIEAIYDRYMVEFGGQLPNKEKSRKNDLEIREIYRKSNNIYGFI